MSPPATVSVIVTTYGRPDSLAACLQGLRAQARPADEVIVVVHTSDAPSARTVGAFGATWPALRRVDVEQRSLVAALNRGLAVAAAEVVAFADDDTVPTTEWLQRLLAPFARDPAIGAVGGRDVVIVGGHVQGREDMGFLGAYRGAPRVGRVQWFGRQIGNHHIGAGGARDVDVLKGANMGFRRLAVAGHGFDVRLRGRGVEQHSELSICLPLRRRGWRLVYDPAIVVHHYPVPRAYGEQREDHGHQATHDAAFNETLQLLDYFSPARRLVFALWGLGIGTSAAPGLVMVGRQRLTGRPHAWSRFAAAQSGRIAAWRTHLASPRVGARAPAGVDGMTTHGCAGQG